MINLDIQFIAGNSITTRRELEELPCPICTLYCTDDEFQRLVNSAYHQTHRFLGLSQDEFIDFNDDIHSDLWWSIIEELAITVYKMPYYEDMTDEEYELVKRM